MAEIFTFPGRREKAVSRPSRQTYRGSGVNIRTLCFRSRELLLESDEADLIRDVCLDIDKAQTKLRKIRERLQSVQEWSADQVEQLTAANIKLSAAIVSALLSTSRGKDDEALTPISPEAYPSKATAGDTPPAAEAVNTKGPRRRNGKDDGGAQ
jgi:hypothetical protein